MAANLAVRKVAMTAALTASWLVELRVGYWVVAKAAEMAEKMAVRMAEKTAAK